MKDKEKQNKVFDILDKMEFFQGQRAGRELWNDKPKEVQDKDISDFIKDINYIRSYLQDSVVLSREEVCELKCQAEEDFNKAYDLGSKETAEKFYNMIYWKAVKYIKGKNKDECFIEMSFEKLDELAKQFGVEIKE